MEWASVLNHQVFYVILRGPLLYVTRFFCSKSWLAVKLTRNLISKISDLFFCEILKSTHDAHWTLINKIVFLKLIIRFWIRPNFTRFFSKQLNQVQCTTQIKTVFILKKIVIRLALEIPNNTLKNAKTFYLFIFFNFNVGTF